MQSKDDKKAADDKKPEKPDGPEIYPMVFAGPMRRLYAFTIDFGLIMMIIYTFAPVAGGHMFSEEAVAPDLIFFFGYFIIPTIIWGRTLVSGSQVSLLSMPTDASPVRHQSQER